MYTYMTYTYTLCLQVISKWDQVSLFNTPKKPLVISRL